jgi:hypothetical protein
MTAHARIILAALPNVLALTAGATLLSYAFGPAIGIGVSALVYFLKDSEAA